MAYPKNETVQIVAAKAGLLQNIEDDVPFGTTERPRNVCWLNIGIRVPQLKDENGNPMVVTLPLGVAVDAMKERPVSASNESTGANAIRVSNALLEHVQGIFAGMAEGQRVVLDDLIIEAYKAPTTKATSVNDENAKQIVASILGKK